MGTPKFAVPSLRELINSRHKVVCVVCQPDKPKGRGRKPASPPIKSLATENSIPVLQPEKIKTELFYEQIKGFNPDFICVAAYGKILPPNILRIPKHGCINVHASLLPKYRGAAPINWAIIDGEEKTGVTTMFMDEGMDTGDILLMAEAEITDEDTSVDISKKLSEIGAELLIKTIDKIEANELTPIKQNDNEATYAPVIKKTIGKIDWKKNADEIRNLIRGTQPWPGAYTTLDKKLLKIFKADVRGSKGKPGEVLISNRQTLRIACGKNSLDIRELQLESSKRMSINNFLNGRKIECGTILG